jgi:3-keto-disaccharide hydrolase
MLASFAHRPATVILALVVTASAQRGAEATQAPSAPPAPTTVQTQPAPPQTPVGSGAQAGRGGGFTEPSPMDFNDHVGYVSLFDGVSLKGWDGNARFWRVEDGAIVGESTAANPSGNSYIVYRDLEAKDFTLKFEIKVEGPGGSGIQYRSRTGLPWLATISPAVTANVGPVNLNWMMTGPQADFWPSRVYTGQFYSENTPMRILAWRGQVVEGFGSTSKKLMGTIGDRDTLGGLVRMNDWNQYTVIARGGTFIHIVNGQLMAVMVDDDPASSNNQPGLFGIEIEATTKVSVRNMWVRKLN